MFGDSDSDSDSENAENTEEEEQQRLGEEEIQRQRREEEHRQREARLDTFRTNASAAEREHLDRRQEALVKNLRKFEKLKQALVVARENDVVIALDKPRKDEALQRIKYTKEYFVGSPKKVFAFASDTRSAVVMDEVVSASRPVLLHFDVEIKRQRLGGQENQTNLVEILTDHVRHLFPEEGVREDNVLEELGGLYMKWSSENWIEEYCSGGVSVVKAVIVEFLATFVLPEDCGDDARDCSVVSGCRADKFSLHIVMNRIYCDSQVVSMPLVVFEIARAFSLANTRWLLRNRTKWGTAEGRFRVRALMLESMCDMREAGQPRLFRGYDDTPFDEAIYTPNHLLRMPGAAKKDGVPPLVPLVGTTTNPMAENKKFSDIFPPDDAGYAMFCGHSVGCRIGIGFSKSYIIRGWKPGGAFPVKRRWYSYRARYADAHLERVRDFDVTLEESSYRSQRYTEKRPTRERQGVSLGELNRVEQGGELTREREPIDLETLFRAESGEKKPFRMFRPGDFLHHVHGGVEERTPSAKCFAGGFTCFGCNKVFAVPKADPVEEPYGFLETETVRSDDPAAYIEEHVSLKDVWASVKKFFVLDAPMGSGKTHELGGMIDIWDKHNGRTVCVVSFRRTLATQQARRFGIDCYLDKTAAELSSNERSIVVCVNSLDKLGGHEFDALVLDECGLVRRHFLSTITANVLGRVFDKFVMLIRAAKFVALLQDGISRDDIQFYTELCSVDAEDRTQVNALKFTKPTLIHPLQYTTQFETAVDCCIRAYENSIDNKVCLHPFMVFCNTVQNAIFLMSQLQDAARNMGSDPERIKGMWGAIRASPFCVNFARDPNTHATEADVILATSMIGAGFSIDCHFQSFHAFLFKGILVHNEEQQFIRRLRYVMAVDLPTDAIRQSYLFVEKGGGGALDHQTVVEDFARIRRIVLGTRIQERARVDERESVLCLENTLARVMAEESYSKSKHDELWRQWGKKIHSPFTEMENLPDERVQAWKKILKSHSSTKKRTIYDMVARNVDDPAEIMSQIETGSQMEMVTAAQADEIVGTLRQGFICSKLARGVIEAWHQGEKKKIEAVLGKKNGVSGVYRQAARLVSWLSYVYRMLPAADASRRMFALLDQAHYRKNRYQLKGVLLLGEYLLPDLFDPTGGETPGYLIQRGALPFFNGMQCMYHEALPKFLKKKMEDEEGDSEDVKKKKEDIRHCYRAVFSDNSFQKLHQITSEPVAAHVFVKQLCKQLGLSLLCTNKRKQASAAVRAVRQNQKVSVYAMQTSTYSVAIACALKASLRDTLVALLGPLLHSRNLRDGDKEWVRDGVEAYNKVVDELGLDQARLGLDFDTPPDGVIPVPAGRILSQANAEDVAHHLRGNDRLDGEDRLDVLVTAAQRASLAALSEQADMDNALSERRAEANRLRATAAITEAAITEAELTVQRRPTYQAPRHRNRFVVDEAEASSNPFVDANEDNEDY